jgi:two-component system chemotaxis sensor kinase CheA
MNGMDEIVKEFLVESDENLDQLDRDLVALERNPTSRETLASVFRTIHTIKGATGFLGFSGLGQVAHAGETLLSQLRDGVLVLDHEITSALLALVDAIRRMLSSIEATGLEGKEDYASLVETLVRLQAGDRAARKSSEPLISPNSKTILSRAAQRDVPAGSGSTPRIGEILLRDALVEERQITGVLKQQREGDPRHMGEILVAQGAIEPTTLVDALHEQKASPTLGVSSSNIRVDVGQLDKLMNLVGELVLSRNQILQLSVTHRDPGLLSASQRLNLITTELQEGIMKTRMQPIDNVWNCLPRVTRDLALDCGKKVRVEMEGRETELDKTIIEAIKDPLTHLVRNSIDHGIETPETRLSIGKAAEGRLFLHASHGGGQVNIEVSDDGAGIDPGLMKRNAVDRNLITTEQASRLSDHEAVNLVFVPGFSTAERVTNISGRGVGMDVVKTNIEKIGGTVDIQTVRGQGTTVKIKIPLTLAIIPALVVTCANERYAIPQISVIELVRLSGHEAWNGIELIQEAPVYRLRGSLLPLVYLDRELKVRIASSQPLRKRPEDEHANIVVLQAAERQFGLVVDEVNDTEEIVVKPLGKQLKAISIFAGATIMGDGKVALILDVVRLAQRASVVSEVRDRTVGDKQAASPENSENCQPLLLFTGPDGERTAIPLSLVTRLEEFPHSAIESRGSQQVVQYRGKILPLLDVSRLLSKRRRQARRPKPQALTERIQTVVCSNGGRSVVLAVDRILDIVEGELTFQDSSPRKGTLGSSIIQGRVTEILDLDVLRAMAESECLRSGPPGTEGSQS